ncbi:MAG: wax ester/triacylglycerol synthase family O-acyltransferase [Halioglobus sp.]
MSLIKQLSREDVMFVAGETSSIYQHVGLLIVLDSSELAGFDYQQFRQHCVERVSLIPQFGWKLHSVPLGLDRPYWVKDENFSFDHHIKHIALPKPGDTASLSEVAAHLYSKHLDRNRPLWEIWLIEGLEGGKCAYFQKFHHCMMDGEGAFKMLEIIGDFESHPPPNKTIDKSISDARAGSIPSLPVQSSKAWQHLSRLPREAAKGVYDILRPKLQEQLAWPRSPQKEQPAVPTASFNGAISSERAVALCSLALQDMKTIKNHFNVSLNDVVLALVSSAVRHYLLEYSQLPDEPLRTNIPVSLRSEVDDQLSNKVTTTTVTLATDLDDPVARLQAINLESEQAKAHAHSGAMGMVELFQMMPPILVSTLMDSLPEDQAAQMVGANLIVSNVRGSPTPMYIAGARMENMYPMSILTAGMGVNFTCISYGDNMDFGIIVDPDLLPHQDTIAVGLETALDEYKALCKPQRKSRKRPAVKAKRKAAP